METRVSTGQPRAKMKAIHDPAKVTTHTHAHVPTGRKTQDEQTLLLPPTHATTQHTAEIEKRADSLLSVPIRHLLCAGLAKPKGARLKRHSAMHSKHANLGRSSVLNTKKDCMNGFRQADSFRGAFSVIAQGIPASAVRRGCVWNFLTWQFVNTEDTPVETVSLVSGIPIVVQKRR
jgi:hypothetical protein